MIKVEIDHAEVERLAREQITERLDMLQAETLFWDTKELQRQTSLSWPTITSTFFHHPDFPKHKVGSKWLIPAAEARSFLLEWIKDL